MSKITIDYSKCRGDDCAECADVCPMEVLVLKGDKIEKLFKMSRLDTDEAILRFSNKLKKMGLDDELKIKGAKEGDTIKILDFEFEFKE